MIPQADPPAESEEWIYIGKVGTVHGVCGEVRLFPLSDVPGRFESLNLVQWMGPSGAERGLHVTACRPADQFYLVSFREITNREQAACLTNGYLAIPLRERGTLPPNQYFLDQVVGLKVETEDGRSLGQVTAIWQTGSNDVYEVHGPEGERLLPAIQNVILRIDLQKQRMTVRLPEEE
jgi:16S rRNA processing protein RimM